jgi:hypothetical protein
MDYRINLLYMAGNQDIMVNAIDLISNHRRILIVAVDYMEGVLIRSILILSSSMYYMILYLISKYSDILCNGLH